VGPEEIASGTANDPRGAVAGPVHVRPLSVHAEPRAPGQPEPEPDVPGAGTAICRAHVVRHQRVHQARRKRPASSHEASGDPSSALTPATARRMCMMAAMLLGGAVSDEDRNVAEGAPGLTHREIGDFRTASPALEPRAVHLAFVGPMTRTYAHGPDDSCRRAIAPSAPTTTSTGRSTTASGTPAARRDYQADGEFYPAKGASAGPHAGSDGRRSASAFFTPIGEGAGEVGANLRTGNEVDKETPAYTTARGVRQPRRGMA
jgi:hypothetical protein